MAKSYQKPFNKQYKEVKIASIIGVIGGLLLTLPAATQMTDNKTKIANIFSITFGTFFLFYCSILFFLYWKCVQYQKKAATNPKMISHYHWLILNALFNILPTWSKKNIDNTLF